MALKIRLKRIGAKKQAVYRVVVAESSFPLKGRVVEELGLYNPRTSPMTVSVDKDKVAAWLKKGARLTKTCERILKKVGS